MLSVLASEPGLLSASSLSSQHYSGEENKEGGGGGRKKVEIWVGGVDESINGEGMIVPGVGDVGDRLFLTVGK